MLVWLILVGQRACRRRLLSRTGPLRCAHGIPRSLLGAVAAAAPVIALANTVALDAKRLTNRLVLTLTKASMRDGYVIRSFFWALLRAGWPVSASIYNYPIQF